MSNKRDVLTHSATTRLDTFRFADAFRREGRLLSWKNPTYDEGAGLWTIEVTVRHGPPPEPPPIRDEANDGRPSVYLGRTVLSAYDPLLERLRQEFKEPRYDLWSKP